MAVLVLSAILPPCSRHIRWVVSAGLAQVSEFSFVLGSRARRAGIISREVSSTSLAIQWVISVSIAPPYLGDHDLAQKARLPYITTCSFSEQSATQPSRPASITTYSYIAESLSMCSVASQCVRLAVDSAGDSLVYRCTCWCWASPLSASYWPLSFGGPPRTGGGCGLSAKHSPDQAPTTLTWSHPLNHSPDQLTKSLELSLHHARRTLT